MRKYGVLRGCFAKIIDDFFILLPYSREKRLIRTIVWDLFPLHFVAVGKSKMGICDLKEFFNQQNPLTTKPVSEGTAWKGI